MKWKHKLPSMCKLKAGTYLFKPYLQEINVNHTERKTLASKSELKWKHNNSFTSGNRRVHVGLFEFK